MADIELPNPHSRLEHYLGIIAGQEGAVLPKGIQSRLELYLRYIIENGSGSADISAIVPEYDPTLTYSEGSLVSHEKLIYIALEDNITGEWDPTKWQETNIAEALTYLDERISALGNIGKYLAIWDCTTGSPTTPPPQGTPYAYTTGDYYIIGKVGTTNYMPDGTTYIGEASTTPDTGSPQVLDMYRFDGATWSWLDFGQQFRQILLDYSTTAQMNAAIEAHHDSTKQNVLDFTPENSANKATSISALSTDTQYPSAKAVYSYIQSLDGNGVSY